MLSPEATGQRGVSVLRDPGTDEYVHEYVTPAGSHVTWSISKKNRKCVFSFLGPVLFISCPPRHQDEF